LSEEQSNRVSPATRGLMRRRWTCARCLGSFLVVRGVVLAASNHWRALTRPGAGAPVTPLHRQNHVSRLPSAASTTNEPRRCISMAFDLLVFRPVRCGDLGVYFTL